MTSTLSRSISSPSHRRVHYSNASLSLSQTFPSIDPSVLNESFTSFLHLHPLVTINYTSTSASKDNQQILLNSYASCRRLLDHLKSNIGLQQDDTIDLMDNDGKLKELNTHTDEYASTYLTSRNTYYAFKIDTVDTLTNQKNYTACFNMDQLDPKLHSILNESMKTLNSSAKAGKSKRPTLGSSKPNSSTQPSLSTTTTQGRNKRNATKK